MKSIRKLNGLGRAKNTVLPAAEVYYKDNSRHQARRRRDDKIHNVGGSLSDHFGEPIVYTRDVSLFANDDIPSGGPKRKAIPRAEHWLAKMKARHAPGHRRILRAEKVLERRKQVEENRREREVNGSL
jgi:hypothetical protein